MAVAGEVKTIAQNIKKLLLLAKWILIYNYTYICKQNKFCVNVACVMDEQNLALH